MWQIKWLLIGQHCCLCLARLLRCRHIFVKSEFFCWSLFCCACCCCRMTINSQWRKCHWLGAQYMSTLCRSWAAAKETTAYVAECLSLLPDWFANAGMLVDAAVQCDIGNRTVNVGSSESGKPVINTEQNIFSISSPDYSFCSSQLTDSQTSDNIYHPSTSQCSNSDTDDAQNSLVEDRKFIVYESHLDKLFSICSICTHTSRVTKHVIGSFIAVTQFCVVWTTLCLRKTS